MAIVTINNPDGTTKTKSSLGLMIERDGIQYEEAIDPTSSERSYSETDVPITGLVPMKYSTLSVKRELAKIVRKDGSNAWDKAKELMQLSGYWDDYILANYISETDPAFVVAKVALIENGVVSQEELDSLLPLCEWTAD